MGVRFVAGAMGLALLAGCAAPARGESRTAVAEPKGPAAPAVASPPASASVRATTATSIGDSIATTTPLSSAALTAVTLPAITSKPATPVSSFPGAANPGLITDNRVFMVGDSVLESAGPAYGDQIRTLLAPLGWVVTMDAEQGRPPSVAVDVLRHRRREISQVVVVLIGNNYNGDERLWATQLDTMMSILDGVREVMFLTVEEFKPEQAEVNAQLRRVAAVDPRVVLVDWNRVVQATRGANGPDGLHLTPLGASVLAATIADALGTFGYGLSAANAGTLRRMP